VCENEELRRIFGPKREEGMEGWRELHNDELYNLYSSSDIIRIMRWAWYVVRMGTMRSA
jgi:hypothetical protein